MVHILCMGGEICKNLHTDMAAKVWGGGEEERGGRGPCIHGETYRPALKKMPFEVKNCLFYKSAKVGIQLYFKVRKLQIRKLLAHPAIANIQMS